VWALLRHETRTHVDHILAQSIWWSDFFIVVVVLR